MPPRKGTKAYREEYVYIYMGLHSETLNVISVWQRRDGVMSGPNGYKHVPHPGSRPESEAALVFHLIEARMVPAHMYQDRAKAIQEELEQVAERIRAEREAKSD
jgi:hypothetical protein